MSVHVISWVLQNSDATLGQRLVLLVLADKAANDGTNAWPSVGTIAREARLSERQVQRCLRELEASGAIEKVGKSERGTNLYRVVMGGDILSPFEVEGGDIRDIGGVTPMSPDPSLEQPSEVDLKPSSDIQNVYDHWRAQRGKTRATYDKISPARRQKIQARLKEFTPAELVLAISGVACDPWEERDQHDDLTVIFRSREQVERFIEFAERGPPRRKGKLTPSEIATMYDHLKEDHGTAGDDQDRRSDQRDLPALEPVTGNSRRLPPDAPGPRREHRA